MLTIKTKELEKRLGKRLNRGIAVGIDTASRTGWCRIVCDNNNTTIDYGFIEIDSKDPYMKYDYMIKTFQSLLDSWKCLIVIEDVFFGRNVNTLKVLARLGMIVYVLSKIGGLPCFFILPGTARAKLGFKGNAKKDFIHKQVVDKLKIDLKDVDVIDAFILALNGVVAKEELEV